MLCHVHCLRKRRWQCHSERLGTTATAYHGGMRCAHETPTSGESKHVFVASLVTGPQGSTYAIPLFIILSFEEERNGHIQLSVHQLIVIIIKWGRASLGDCFHHLQTVVVRETRQVHMCTHACVLVCMCHVHRVCVVWCIASLLLRSISDWMLQTHRSHGQPAEGSLGTPKPEKAHKVDFTETSSQ